MVKSEYIMRHKKRVIIISELGWQGARQLSIELSKNSIRPTVLIRGRPAKDERGMINKYNGIRNVFIPQKLFAFISLIYMIYCSFFQRRYLSLLQKKRQRRPLRG